ncbi:MAG: ATP-binding protein [Chlamydiia bacterium]|nr:ATP-binding protein [Chlamydiia bacterium]MCB1116073.1 ATP-binding protein [Chlamydiia bacterium]
MLFLVGPRQVGKTTISHDLSHLRKTSFYLSWDDSHDRKLILSGLETLEKHLKLDQGSLQEELPLIIFDELHKYRKWKNFLKGFYDKFSKKIQIIVTGSARLDIYKMGGDSLMGRYFLYHIHPFTVGEVLGYHQGKEELLPRSNQISPEDFHALYTYGGFPDPFIKRDRLFYNQWKRLRFQQLFTEDLRDLTLIQDLDQMQILAELLQHQAGQLTSYSSLANKVNVTIDTISRWIKTLKSFYYCFTLKPWTKNISRSLLKEPKVYLWDWSLVEDEGAKKENFIASHLLKAVHFWTDRGFGDCMLYFIRDKEKKEVDFLVTKDQTPWFLVEVKSSKTQNISKALRHFQQLTQAKHAFQVCFDLEYFEGNCFALEEPTIVPAATFLSQLL